jgi:CrcB protein
MVTLLWVGAGGFVGSVLRYLVSGWVQRSMGGVGFPWGTLVVNVVGCFVIGGLSYLADSRGFFQSDTRLFLFVGVIGGFTTFSAFGNETMNLLRVGQVLGALANIAMNVVLCLAAVWLGRLGAYSVWR